MVLDRKKIKSKLKQEVERTYDQRDAGFSKSVLDPEKMREANVKRYSPKIPGEHLVDVLLFEVGEQHPVLSPGDYTYVVEFYAHRGLGPNEDDFVCMSKTYGKPCYPCEHTSFLRKKDRRTDEDEAIIEYGRAKQRVAYAIWDRKKEDEGVQIFEVSRFFFHKNLLGQIKSKKTGEVLTFCDPDEDGRSIGFEISGSPQSQSWGGFQLCERDEPIPDRILEAVPSVDNLLYIPEYGEVKKAFLSGLTILAEEKEEEGGDECPYGGVFGDSFELLEECNTVCEFYKHCYDRFVELGGLKEEDESESEPEPEPEPERRGRGSRLRAVEEEEPPSRGSSGTQDEAAPSGRRRPLTRRGR